MKDAFILLFLILISSKVFSQTIPVAAPDFSEERSRNEVVLGVVNSRISFSIRPLITIDTLNAEIKTNTFQLLPLSLTQQYHTYAPYGWNDGALIPAKGYQQLLSAGFKAKIGSFSLQLKPEWVYAANPNFEQFPLNETDAVKLGRTEYLNQSDVPERFGNKSYQRLSWGQSSLRFNTSHVSFGLSTENLWWGPGTRNSLIMTNHAPGFLHLTLNTLKPLKTSWGNFEGQLVAGKLENSGFSHSVADFTAYGKSWEEPKPQDWRYVSGLTINYQPKWVPGLFIGLNRVFQIYHTDLGTSFSDYFPILTPFQKKNVIGEDAKRRDQVASIFFRWVLKESRAEFYMEYGWNDHAQNFWDLIQSPEHSRAYLAGFRKLFWLDQSSQKYLKFNMEYTQMQQTQDLLIRAPGSWYLHYQVVHGYTHRGEILGAGIGPGSNLQAIDISVWQKNKVYGFQLERLAHNKDFFYKVYTDYERKWVDVILNTYTYRSFGKLGLQTNLGIAWMRNYQWQLDNHKLNMQFKTTLTYKF